MRAVYFIIIISLISFSCYNYDEEIQDLNDEIEKLQDENLS